MSAAIAFDTRRFVKNLTASGFTEQQAEALAREQINLLEAKLATRADLSEAKADLEVKIETVKSDLEVKIEQVRSDLELKIEQVRSGMQVVKVDILKWMIGAMTAHAAFIAALVWYLFTSGPGG